MPRAVSCRRTCRTIPTTARPIRPDAPILMLALTSDARRQGADVRRRRRPILQQSIAQVDGVGQVVVGGGALPAVRVEVNPTALHAHGLGLEDVARVSCGSERQPAEGRARRATTRSWSSRRPTSSSRPTSISRSSCPYIERRGAAARMWRTSPIRSRTSGPAALPTASPAVLAHRLPPAGREHHRHRRRRSRAAAAAPGVASPGGHAFGGAGSDDDDPRLGARRRAHDADLHRARHPGGLRVPAQRARHADPGVAVPVSLIGTFGVDVSARLQPGQPVADGADHRHRIRR